MDKLPESTNSPAASLTSEPEKLLPEPAAIDCTICGAQVAVWPEAMVCHCQTVPWKARLSSPVSGTDMVMVPREPTEAMRDAAYEAWASSRNATVRQDFAAIWVAMLAAAPALPIPVIAEAGEREKVAAAMREAWLLHKADSPEGFFDHMADVAIATLSTPATLDNTAVEGQNDNTLSFLVEPEFLFSADDGDCVCCGGPHCFTMRVRPIGPDGEPIIGRWDRSYDNAEDVISDFLWRKQDGRLVNRSDDDLVFHAGNRPGDKGYCTGSGNMFRITVSPATLTAKTEKAK